MGFQHGLSGLNASSKNLDVIGHNIANMAPPASRPRAPGLQKWWPPRWARAVATTTASASRYRGAKTFEDFMGNVTVTGNNLDVAINGNEFFKVLQPDGSAAYPGRQFQTRQRRRSGDQRRSPR